MKFYKQNGPPHFLVRVFLYGSHGNTSLQIHLMELVGTNISEMYSQIKLAGTSSKIQNQLGTSKTLECG